MRPGKTCSVTAIMATMVTMIILALLPTAAHGADWPSWRGPDGSGVSSETNWNPQALAGGARILFAAEVGMGHSAVSVQGDRAYTMGNREVTSGPHAGEHEDLLFCLSAKTGREIWHYSYASKEGEDPGPGSTPVVDGNAVFAIGREGQVMSLDATTGELLWRRNIVTEEMAPAHEWGFAGSPVVAGDLLLLDAGKSGIAIAKSTGERVWLSEHEECSFTTPVVFGFGGKQLVAISADESLHIMDLSNGERLWQHELRAIADPVVVGDRLFMAGRQAAMLQMTAGGPKVLWEQRELMSHFQNPVVIGEYIYGIGRDRRGSALQCADLATGEQKWQHPIGGNGALIGAGDKLIVIAGQGWLRVVQASPEAYQELSAAKVLEMADNTGVPNRRQCHCWTAPTLANGLAWVRNSYGELACVDMRE